MTLPGSSHHVPNPAKLVPISLSCWDRPPAADSVPASFKVVESIRSSREVSNIVGLSLERPQSSKWDIVTAVAELLTMRRAGASRRTRNIARGCNVGGMKSWGLHTFSPDTRDMMGNWSEDGGLEIVVLSLAWCGRSQLEGPAGKFEARGFSKFVCGHVAGLLG
jgi:hypothetical protein